MDYNKIIAAVDTHNNVIVMELCPTGYEGFCPEGTCNTCNQNVELIKKYFASV